MATNLTTADVAAGDDILATHHNNMRDDIIKNAGDFEDTAGSSNAYTLAIDTGYSAYADGDKHRFIANFANTAASTLNVNSIGAKSIKKRYDDDLESGDLVSGGYYEVVYDATNDYFQLITPENPKPISSVSVGTDNWAPTGNGQTKVIAHGLGKTPKIVRITWGLSATTNSSNECWGYIIFDGTSNAAVGARTTANPGYTFGVGTTAIIDNKPTAGTDWAFSISVDATNITLTSSAYNASNGIVFTWEAIG